MKFQPSDDTKDKVHVFELADAAYKLAWEKFEMEHATELAFLDKLREDRNAKLDDARRVLRGETELIDEMRASFKIGPFTVQKKWSDFYIPEKLVALLKDRGLYDTSLSSGIVAVKVETAKFDQVRKFLEDHGVAKDFECCEDGAEAGSAIAGPKSVPTFGSELKKE